MLSIWLQAAVPVHASQQKSPQEWHATKLLPRELADLMEIVIIIVILQVKRSKCPSEVIYKQKFA